MNNPKTIKQISVFILCLVLVFSAASCKNGKNNNIDPSISDIPTAEAEKDVIDDESNAENQDSDTKEYSEAETEKYINSETKDTDYRSERERVEISNNLRDAEELIDNGDYEDAMMIIQSLKTRKLSDDESKKLKELQKKMINVSD